MAFKTDAIHVAEDGLAYAFLAGSSPAPALVEAFQDEATAAQVDDDHFSAAPETMRPGGGPVRMRTGPRAVTLEEWGPCGEEDDRCP
ncbi:hypothetical protein ACFYXH_11655 [Streptomyces sp. NPDC002730]|uniref:hypothetical protein n=1 Tax=Streptomyces sp. NPDC002730 TaxID=3364662 RepID=UPI0036991E59